MHGITTQTLQLQGAPFKNNEFKKYRDAVCSTLDLHFQQVDGLGDCFFHSVAVLLQYVRQPDGAIWEKDPSCLRQEVTLWLRECVEMQHGIVGERCVMDMEGEVGTEMVSSSRKNSGIIPDNIREYLDVSAIDGVWVQGYHWLRAVASIYDICLGVVVHNHDYVHLFGDITKQRLFFYKRDAHTHYDALPPGQKVPFRVAIESSSSSDGESAPDVMKVSTLGVRTNLAGSVVSTTNATSLRTVQVCTPLMASRLRPRQEMKKVVDYDGSESIDEGDEEVAILHTKKKTSSKLNPIASRPPSVPARPPPVAAPDFFIESIFNAKNKEEATEWLMGKFEESHQGGDIICRNSRFVLMNVTDLLSSSDMKFAGTITYFVSAKCA
jgi:hypothetical protein